MGRQYTWDAKCEQVTQFCANKIYWIQILKTFHFQYQTLYLIITLEVEQVSFFYAREDCCKMKNIENLETCLCSIFQLAMFWTVCKANTKVETCLSPLLLSPNTCFLYMGVFVNLYLYLRICICVFVFVYLYLCICICVFVFVYLYLCICLFIHLYFFFVNFCSFFEFSFVYLYLWIYWLRMILVWDFM